MSPSGMNMFAHGLLVYGPARLDDGNPRVLDRLVFLCVQPTFGRQRLMD